MKKLLILALVVLQAGCAYNARQSSSYSVQGGIGNEYFKVAGNKNRPKIEFVTRSDIGQFCSTHVGHQRAIACAIWAIDHSKCTIYVAPQTHSSIVGHEVRHCFAGSFH